MDNIDPSVPQVDLSAEKEAEERKRDAYLARHPELRWKYIGDAIAYAEACRPPEQRRNRPRPPHQPLN